MPSTLPKWRPALAFATAIGLTATLCGALERDRPVELTSLALLTVTLVPLLASVARGWLSRAEVIALREKTQAEAFAMAIGLWRDGQLTGTSDGDGESNPAVRDRS
ncbi:hypothetical protein ACIRVF_07800 [Kitasatospora sp. NPDC101157]|uniref:hypothetical protein n=1 Tax=Kitasatospora sp. NPDC101157 TaxID=3364098 RepID=UPI003825FC4C